MDYDGPAGELAGQMADAANDVLTERGSFGYYPVERLGSSPGSMGSFVGVDLGLPIVTLEFATHHDIETLDQLEAIHASIQAAATWVRDHGTPLPAGVDLEEALGELEDAAENPDGYTSWRGATSSGSLSVLADGIGGGLMERPVWVMAGPRDNSREALHVAEHVRLACSRRPRSARCRRCAS